MTDEPIPTRVKVENGPVTIEIEGVGLPADFLEQAMVAYREVAATPPYERPVPPPGTTDARIDLAGQQFLGFHGEVPTPTDLHREIGEEDRGQG